MLLYFLPLAISTSPYCQSCMFCLILEIRLGTSVLSLSYTCILISSIHRHFSIQINTFLRKWETIFSQTLSLLNLNMVPDTEIISWRLTRTGSFLHCLPLMNTTTDCFIQLSFSEAAKKPLLKSSTEINLIRNLF